MGRNDKGLTVPSIRQWTGPASGFAFHCWIRLDNNDLGGSSGRQKEQRRQLYSFYTSSGNGFERFWYRRSWLRIRRTLL